MIVGEDMTNDGAHLYRTAVSIANRIPDELADAVGVTGSVALGRPDRFSDIDLNAWSHEIDGVAAYSDWFVAEGAEEILVLREVQTDHRHFVYRYADTFVDIDWTTWRRFDAALADVDLMLTGEIEASDELQLIPWMLSRLLVLRWGELPERIMRYRTYPVEFGDHVVTEQIHEWLMKAQFPPSKLSNHDAFARGELPYARQRQLDDIRSVFRVLFALNRMWMPDARWLIAEARELAVRPDALLERVGRVLFESEASVAALLQLIGDTMALMPDRADAIALREMLGGAAE